MNKIGKKIVLTLILVLAATNLAQAEIVRIGAIAQAELMEKSYEEALDKFKSQDILPGIYSEVLLGNLGLGTTLAGIFERRDSELPGMNNEWKFHWIGSLDLRFHLFGDFIIDPFAELGVGCAGVVALSEEEAGPEALSLFGQLGAGVALRLDGFHVGAKGLYRFLNEVPPATDFLPYPVKRFQVSIFAGVSL